ncbi:MAG TPA: M24 family metallopeptidase [Gaiellales bacterium]|jgi:Xaa-Pro aminopeptidase
MADPRLQAYLEACDADALLTADPGLVRMLTGHAAEVGFGPSPFQLPALAVAARAAPAQLVCSADEAPAGEHTHVYEGFTTAPLDPLAGAAAALHAAMAAAGVSAARTLVDGASVPAGLMPGVAGAAAAPLAGLGMLPATKTAAEVEAVEAALRLCEAGHAAARAATREGAGELDLWAAVSAAVEAAAGGRTTVIADLLSGARTEDIGGPPVPRTLARGDLVLADIVPRLDGIWGDSCATWAVGEPPPAAVAMHALARSALATGLAALRPGAVAGDVDRAVRAEVEAAGHSYPHHTGHGLGFGWHEEPRIVPGSATVLEPGMVVALEPGAYRGGIGVRVEVVAVVTGDGCRVLSRHPLDLAANARTEAA